MLGDSSDDYMVRCAVKWLHKQGFSVLAMSPDKKDYGHHNLPLERFGAAIKALKENGIEKIGIIGASTTGILALIAASYYPAGYYADDCTFSVGLCNGRFLSRRQGRCT